MKIVNKPWGYEKWIAQTDKYILKEIFMKAGQKSSLQYHLKKDESNYILEGTAMVHLRVNSFRLVKGDTFTVEHGDIHRVEAVDDLTMIEVSTPEVDDVVRLEDDYNRPNGRIESEHIK